MSGVHSFVPQTDTERGLSAAAAGLFASRSIAGDLHAAVHVDLMPTFPFYEPTGYWVAV